jgi:hypothetical protein
MKNITPLAAACLILLPGVSLADEYQRALPLYAQEAIDAGAALPLPYGFSVLYNRIEDDTEIDNLRRASTSGPDSLGLKNINFGDSSSTTDVFDVRFDAWLLPFLNIYAVGGYLEGTSDTDVILTTQFSPREIVLETEESYYGTNIGVGMTLVYAWGQWVASLDMNYAKTELNLAHSDIESIMVAPRFGYMTEIGGTPSTFMVGATYMDIQQTLTVKEPIPGTNQELTLLMDIEGKHPWNMVLTGSFELSRHWSVVTEVGFAQRESLLANLTYRF